MISRCTIRRALADPNLLGRALAGDSWAPWRTLLIAAMGEELADEERELFKQLTGREHEPGRRVDELVLVVGRKGGKTRCMALLAVYLATLVDHRAALSVGERGVVLVVAQSQAVAKVLLRYAEGIIRQSPLLRSLVVNHTQDSIELKSGITIEVRPCNYKSLRGPNYCAALCDEAAFWFVDSEAANPDTEVIAAIKPALGLTHGLLTIASSPYAKKKPALGSLSTAIWCERRAADFGRPRRHARFQSIVSASDNRCRTRGGLSAQRSGISG
jgi:hypothetical protein